MKIEIEIPKSIAERLLENNWTAEQCKSDFHPIYGFCYE